MAMNVKKKEFAMTEHTPSGGQETTPQQSAAMHHFDVTIPAHVVTLAQKTAVGRLLLVAPSQEHAPGREPISSPEASLVPQHLVLLPASRGTAGSSTAPETAPQAAVPWLLALEWQPEHTAWEALLLLEQEQRSPLFTLAPEALLPALCLASLAQSTGSATRQISAWEPVLAACCHLLGPYLVALYQCWMDGPSKRAGLYRQFVEHVSSEQVIRRYVVLLSSLASVLGWEHMETLDEVEYLECALLQVLRDGSRRLWDATRPLWEKQQLATLLLAQPPLRALLPLALWTPETPLTGEHPPFLTLDAVYQSWKRFMQVDTQ